MIKFPFASRTRWTQDLNTFNLALNDLQARQEKILDLTQANPTACGIMYPEGLLPAFNTLNNLKYIPEAFGIPEARQVIADQYGSQQQPLSYHQIFLTASTSEAYAYIMRLLLNPGEKVLIPKPSYPLFQFLLDINDVNYATYPLVYDGQWRIDQERFEMLLDDTARAVIVVNPNNPTGSYINRDEMDFLNKVCEKRNMAIIADEVFFDYQFIKGDYLSFAGNSAALTFCLGGLSKSLGLPQMKCAWGIVSGPKDIASEAINRLEIIADTYLSVNTPVQHALKPWFAMKSQIQGQIMARVQANATWLSAHLDTHTQCLFLEGGWSVTLRIPAIKSEEAWVLEFLQKDHVAVYPGYFFDFEKEAYIIVSLLPEPSVFQEAMGRLMSRFSKINS